MQAIENGERREDPDHVFGFLDRASRPQAIGRGKVLGERTV
jgi:hypothetical protein